MKYILTFAAGLLIGISNLPVNEISYVRAVEADQVRDLTKMIPAIITAYTSSVEETDDTPEITAAGTKTRDGVVANNCLPFGTEIVIEGRTYVVEDRMNRRYGCEHYDIWLQDREDAIEWGKKHLSISIKI